jgi:hypothetical protein
MLKNKLYTGGTSISTLYILIYLSGVCTHIYYTGRYFISYIKYNIRACNKA